MACVPLVSLMSRLAAILVAAEIWTQPGSGHFSGGLVSRA